MFGEVVGRVPGAGGESEGGMELFPSRWLLWCVVERKEMSSRLLWERVKVERESWVFMSAFGQGSKKSDEDIENISD